MPGESPNTRSKVLFGLSLLFLGAILVFGKPNPLPDGQPSSSYTFAEEPVEARGFEEGQEGELPTRIIIPDLLIDLEVKAANVVKGYWEVFIDSAAWGKGSGFPGEKGNQVIFAHAREGLFLPLKDIKEGMSVYVTTEDDWYSYEVKEVKEVTPDRVEVISPTEDETLTLYTCSGFKDEKRLIVVAKPTN